jgi:exodeoxyribonuclease-3
MGPKIATWNINSVRLRSGLVQRFLTETKPDILCLQETKCQDSEFPSADFRKLGYKHIAVNGQKGYHGVAILSRWPFAETQSRIFAEKPDSRHISVRFADDAGKAAGLSIHNFYVPAGGDVPDPDANEKFAHKLAFLDAMRDWGEAENPASKKAILVGDLNVAPLEHDVWSHKQMIDVVSHTPIECNKLNAAIADGQWVDAVRHLKPEPEKLYTWWSYRAADWAASNRGRRLDHMWVSQDLAGSLKAADIHRDSRGWERPSDHVPVSLTLT